MKAPDDKSLEDLLQAQIRQPSARFEEALRQIPGHDAEHQRRLLFRSLQAAAAVAIITTTAFLALRNTDAPADAAPAVAVSDSPLLDKEWIELLALAESVKGAESLADAEARTILEYYVFNP